MTTALRHDDAPTIVRLDEHLAYENHYVKVYNDPVRFPNGAEGSFNRIQVGDFDGVAILPVRDGMVGLVRQYRYSVGAFLWEAPRGGADSSDAEAEARRELAEETGAVAADIVSLGSIHPDTGVLASTVHLFLACLPAEAMFAAMDEVDDAIWLPTGRVLDMVASGEIADGFTIALVARAHLRGLI